VILDIGHDLDIGYNRRSRQRCEQARELIVPAPPLLVKPKEAAGGTQPTVLEKLRLNRSRRLDVAMSVVAQGPGQGAGEVGLGDLVPHTKHWSIVAKNTTGFLVRLYCG
jgi:hypothetical protein